MVYYRKKLTIGCRCVPAFHWPIVPPPFPSFLPGWDLKMAERIAARLAAQEEQIELLSNEIKWLRDGICGGQDMLKALANSPELEELRTENEKLKYRLIHLRRALQEERAVESQQGHAPAKKGLDKKDKVVKENQKNNVQQNHTQHKVFTVLELLICIAVLISWLNEFLIAFTSVQPVATTQRNVSLKIALVWFDTPVEY